MDWQLEDLPSYPDRIKDFVDSCQSEVGGYGFCPGIKPNVYATRLALQLYKLLDIQVSRDRAQKITDFINSLKDQEYGGYLGFSPKSEPKLAA